MRYDPESHHRQSTRWRGYDYSIPGAYFITICIEGRECLLGDVVEGTMVLSHLGQCVEECWRGLPERFARVHLDAMQIMPNHLHALICLTDESVGTRSDLPSILRAFKSISAIAINHARGHSQPVWQRGYYDRVIRDEQDLEAARQYILNNPARWQEDQENPSSTRSSERSQGRAKP